MIAIWREAKERKTLNQEKPDAASVSLPCRRHVLWSFTKLFHVHDSICSSQNVVSYERDREDVIPNSQA